MARKCNCSGFCGPQANLENSANSLPELDEVDETDGTEQTEPAVTRREFISLTSIGMAGALLAGTPRNASARGRLQPNPELLAEWKRSLFQPAAPRRYRSHTHTDARMPLGGIGTGNVEIGADGQFTTWQLFNTLRDGNVPFFFGVKAGKTAKLLQTVGGPDGLPHINRIEMTGEYPCATLRFEDTDLPIQVQMRAFTPFAPLDTAFSSLPVACLVFTLHNPTDQEQPVSLAGFLQNPIGYDAMGAPLGFHSPNASPISHPNFGGNSNTILHEANATLLAMRAQPAADMSMDLPLHLYTNLPANAFNTPYEGRPTTLTVAGLDHLPASSSAPASLPAVSSPPASLPATLIWLEDAPADMAVFTLQSAVAAVRAGATLVFSGRTLPLLQKYAELAGGKPFDMSNLRPDVLFEDFEKGYENWTVEGTAFGAGPAQGALPSQQPVSGFLGKGFVNSFLGGDDTTGKLISKPFRIDRSFIRFLIGGGSHPTTQIRLLVDGKIVRATSGHDEERLLPAFWDVQIFAGKEAHLEIVDEQKGPWGHINIDEIQFCDLPGSREVLGLLDQILPARFSGIRTLPAANSKNQDKSRNKEIVYQDLMLQNNAREERLSDGRPLLVRPLGAGKVALTFGSILMLNQVELLGARREAYRTLALLAGAHLQGAAGTPDRAPGFGTLTLGVISKATSHNADFTDWQTGWNAFAAANQMASAAGVAAPPTAPGETINGALVAHVVVPPGKTVEVPFFLTWHYPNKYSGATWVGNHYSTVWPDSLAVAKEAVKQFPVWRERTERFRSVFYDSTLPYWLLDCLTSQAATIRHIGIVFRIANGDVYGWEGSNGCCDPTCTHVWGYTMNMARLYPDLERDMRRIDYKRQQNPDGGVNNRTAVPSPPHPSGEHPFTDGHCSTILKAYREALNTPDERWLKEYWPGIKKSVEYLIARDAATSGGMPNGLLEDDQWNTYDEALHGVSGFIGTYYLAALRAGEAMATRMGDSLFAQRCLGIFQEGQKNLIARCWNGEYLQQNLPGYERMNGEVGPGCMADQVIGQWWAHQLGLGYLLPPEMIKTALKSVFKYNWMPDLTGWKHNPRAFAGAGDKGLIICTWPKGGRPSNVMLYSDEVWTGIEYQVASHMLYEGMIEEGFAITKGARDRYDGIPRAPIPRSPWNEIECGGHYARAGSSWALLLALSGWFYDGMSGELTFRPLHTPERFKSFFSGSEGWGSLSQTRKGNSQHSEITLVEGKLAVTQLHLDAHAAPKQVSVKVGGKPVAATLKPVPQGTHQRAPGSVYVVLARPLFLKAGQTLAVTLTT